MIIEGISKNSGIEKDILCEKMREFISLDKIRELNIPDLFRIELKFEKISSNNIKVIVAILLNNIEKPKLIKVENNLQWHKSNSSIL